MTTTRRALALAVLTIATPALGGAAAPSFDCARAGSDAEKAICASPKLASLDRDLGNAYHARLAHEPALAAQQRSWLMARDVGCGKDAACLAAFMTARTAWLSAAAPMPRALPRRIGQCSLTTLSRKTHRFEGEPDSGSAAEFANGARQVSYDTIAPLEASRKGDPVVFCFDYQPEDCPPGDDRGKGYVAANLRTHQAWSLSDSEHSCGGA